MYSYVASFINEFIFTPNSLLMFFMIVLPVSLIFVFIIKYFVEMVQGLIKNQLNN